MIKKYSQNIKNDYVFFVLYDIIFLVIKMGALDNISRINYRNDAVMKLIKLYQYKGKEFYYHNILKADRNYIAKQTVAKDTFYVAKLMNLNVSENRMRLVINKNSAPKTSEEKVVANLKRIFEITCEKAHEFELIPNGVLSLASRLYKDVKQIKFETQKVAYQVNLLTEFKSVSKREDLKILLDKYIDLLSTEQYENVSLVVNFYIDFINIKPFKDESEIVGLLLLYVLLFRESFDINIYESFFEFIYNNYDEFKQHVIAANYNWEAGFSHTEPLTDFFINHMLANYDKLEKLIRDYEYDSKLNKGDNIENTIYRVPQIFTKEDIRAKHPFVSDSTINRTLQRLRDEGKISPLGTGRSAKWMRVTHTPERFNPYEQLDIFGLSDDDE